MAEVKIVGYKKIFGLILPDWVSEKMLRAFVAGMLSVLVMLLVAVFYIRPMYDTIVSLEANLKTEKVSLTNLQQSKTGIDSMQQQLSGVDISKILAAIPGSYSPDTAIFILREIANETGVSIVSYSLPSGVLLDTSSVDSTNKKNDDMVGFSSYPIKIVIAAPVDVLLRFINKVENSLPFGVVSDLNLQEVTKLSRQVQNKNVQIAMELRYFQSQLGRVNINKIKTLTDKNVETAGTISDFDLITLDAKEAIASPSAMTATNSADMFGF